MWVMLDVETTGPIPGRYSMFWFGAVIVEPELKYSFEGKLCPLFHAGYEGGPENNKGLKLAGVSRQEIMQWPEPLETMSTFLEWLNHQRDVRGDDRIMLVSDNNGFDAMFINWYFHTYLEESPFGHSSTNLGSLYKGMEKNTRVNFKFLRKTAHTHNPVDDAMGNAEAMLHMIEKMGLRT